MAALRQAIDERKGSARCAARRVDIDIDGQQVIHLTMPMRGPAVLPHFDVDLNNLDEDRVKARLEEQRQKAADAKQISIDEVHTFFARVGDRILVATTFPQSETEVRALLGDDPDKKIDLAPSPDWKRPKGSLPVS